MAPSFSAGVLVTRPLLKAWGWDDGGDISSPVRCRPGRFLAAPDQEQMTAQVVCVCVSVSKNLARESRDR